MALTTRKKISLGLMVLSLGALGVDLLLRQSGPSAAQGALDGALAAGLEAAGLGPADADEVFSSIGLDLSSLEARFGSSGEIPDVFASLGGAAGADAALLSAFTDQSPAAGGSAAAGGAGASTTEPVDLADTLPDVTVVLGGSAGGAVVVAGSTYRPGEIVDGWTLRSVRDRTALFTRDGHRGTVMLPLGGGVAVCAVYPD